METIKICSTTSLDMHYKYCFLPLHIEANRVTNCKKYNEFTTLSQQFAYINVVFDLVYLHWNFHEQGRHSLILH